MAGSAALRRRELRRYISVLNRWGWLMLLAAAIAAGTGYVTSKRQAPAYHATALLFVDQHSPGGSAYQDLLASAQLGQTYLGLITTPPIVQRAARQLGGISPAALATRVHVSNAGTNTQIIQVQAADRNPSQAALIANAVAAAFVATQKQYATVELNDATRQVNQQIASATAQIPALTNRINDLQSADPLNPQLVSLRAQLDTLVQRRSALQAVSSDIAKEILLDADNIRLYAPAVAPTTPTQPAPRLTAAVAGLGGLILAIGVAILVEMLDDRIRTSAGVERATGLSTLGTLRSQPKGRTLLTANSSPGLVESFQILRTNLALATRHESLSTLVITGAMSGEGKTTVAINVAISLSSAGQRVLLVDADVRHPTVHRYLGLANDTGLTQYLLEQDQHPETEPPLTSLAAVPNLHVLTAGPPLADPTTMLGSARMHAFLASVLPSPRHPGLADIVVLDAPPVLDSADAAVLAADACATLLVVDATRSRAGRLVRAYDALVRVGADVVGVVLNHAQQNNDVKTAYAYDLAHTAHRKAVPRDGAASPGLMGNPARNGLAAPNDPSASEQRAPRSIG